MSILIISTSAVPVYILLAANQLISSVVTMKQKMKEEGENLGNHHDDDGILDNDAK